MEGKLFRNIFEVVGITLVTSTLWYLLPFIFGCKPQPDFCALDADRCKQMFCPNGQYSEIGSITFSSSDIIIRNLFDRSVGPEFEFDPWYTI